MVLPTKLTGFFRLSLSLLAAVTAFASACTEEDPPKENVPELITQVTLTFTPVSGGTAVTATATDPDGDGVQDIEVDGPVNLTAGQSYTLTLELVNGLATPGSPGYDLTEEIDEEAEEHLFFFGWTGAVFSDPPGDGNIDARSGEVDYNDSDAGGLPLGLSTSWTAASTPGSGTLRIVLKHQPGTKSATSESTDGETDLDLSFDVTVN
jgi:hypothetical protein